MVATKMLYVILIALIVFGVYFLLTISINQEAGAVIQEGIGSFKDAGQCALGQFVGVCNDLDGVSCKENPSCILCERSLDSGSVTKCEQLVCGCSFGWRIVSGNVIFSLDREFYYPGDTITIIGKFINEGSELESPAVEISFTDIDRNRVEYLGASTAIGSADEDSNYQWEHVIPEGLEAGNFDVVDGVYLLKLEYNSRLYFLDFRIYKNPENIPSEEGGTEEQPPITEPEQPPTEEEPPEEEEPPVEPPVEEAPVEEEKPPVEEPTPTPVESVTLDVFMIQYGDYMTDSELESFKESLEEAIPEVTENSVSLNIDNRGSVPMPQASEEYNYGFIAEKYPWLNEDSLDRAWYYEVGGGSKAGISSEEPMYRDIIDAMTVSGFSKDKYDLSIVITEAQITAPARFHGNIFPEAPATIIIEQPNEGGIDDERIYSTLGKTEYMLLDNAIHEIGHYLGLGHHCDRTRCGECKSSTDVMSYCRPNRDHPGPSDEFYGTFGSCSLKIIKSKTVPSITDGTFSPSAETVCNDRL